MKTYTLHLPAGATRGDPYALEQAKLVRDGFSWGAFAFTFLWFLRHRLWLASLFVAAFLAAMLVGVRVIGLAPGAAMLVMLLASVLIGLEASSLRRWTYGRNEMPARDAVIAESLQAAEVKAFAKWLDQAAMPAVARATIPAAMVKAREDREAVIGLFPASEAAR